MLNNDLKDIALKLQEHIRVQHDRQEFYNFVKRYGFLVDEEKPQKKIDNKKWL